MIGLSIRLNSYDRCRERNYLSQAQKVGLKQLLAQRQNLRHPEYPGAVKGLEGMQAAHQILQEKEASGVLIGGLAEAVWNQRRKPEDLYTHKDVDVAVLDDHFKIYNDFEGGIDWWMPQDGRISVNYESGKVEGIYQRWYQNANNAVLSFGLTKNADLDPGLYIPGSRWVVDMREAEAEANVDHGRADAEFDEEVFIAFRQKIREKVKTRLPRFIRETFAGYILSEHYQDYYDEITTVDIEWFNLPKIRAIKGIESKIEE